MRKQLLRVGHHFMQADSCFDIEFSSHFHWNRDANLAFKSNERGGTSVWMHAEWRFDEVVQLNRHVRVKARRNKVGLQNFSGVSQQLVSGL